LVISPDSYDYAMCDLAFLLLHLVTVARLAGTGGVPAIVAESGDLADLSAHLFLMAA
jgi:hypothetical protein